MTDTDNILRIAGSGGGGKSGGSGQTPTESKNNLQADTMAFIQDLVSEGEIYGLPDGLQLLQCIYLNETPVQNPNGSFNYAGMSAILLPGTPTQPYVPGFSIATPLDLTYGQFLGPESKANGAALDLPNGLPWYGEVQDTGYDAVQIIIEVPALTYVDTTTGDMTGNRVDVQISYQQQTGPNQNWVHAINDTIAGKCVAPYERSYRITLPQPGPWSLMVWRNTRSDYKSNEQKGTAVAAAIGLQDEKLSYPNSAIASLAFNMQYFNNQIPQRNFHFWGLKVLIPSNYNPITRLYSTDVWDGTFVTNWTNNPVWILYDLLTHPRRGLGDMIDPTQVDVYALYAIAQYCDAYMARPYNTQDNYTDEGMHGIPDGSGGFEPRFTFNAVLNTAAEAYQVIQSVAAAFFGMTYWGTGAVTAIADQPKDITQIVGPADVIGGKFNYVSSKLKDRHSVVLVSWNDPKNFYQPTIEEVTSPAALQRYGYRVLKVTAYGCTRQSQARRLGMWILDTELNESEVVSYSCGLDHLLVRPGDIVGVADPLISDRQFAGRVVSVTSTTVTLDRQVALEGDDVIYYQNGDASVGTAPIVFNPVPSDILQFVTEPTDGGPQQGQMWVLSTGQTAVRPWRVLAIKEMKRATFDISGTAYDPTKWARIEFGVTLQPPNYSSYSRGAINPPSALLMQETISSVNGVTTDTVALSWTASMDDTGHPDSRVTGYSVAFIGPTNVLTNIGVTSTCSTDIPNAVPGTYTIYVTAQTPFGNSVALVTPNVVVTGKNAPPADVTNFAVVNGTTGINLSWNAVENVLPITYEIHEGTSWDTGTVIGSGLTGLGVFVPVTDFEVHTFFIKAVDACGTYSQDAATCEGELGAPPDVTTLTANPSGSNVILNWSAVTGLGVTYIVRVGPTWDTATQIVATAATSATVLYPGKSVLATFWVAALSSLGVRSINPIQATCVILSDFPNFMLELEEFDESRMPQWQGNMENCIEDNDLNCAVRIDRLPNPWWTTGTLGWALQNITLVPIEDVTTPGSTTPEQLTEGIVTDGLVPLMYFLGAEDYMTPVGALPGQTYTVFIDVKPSPVGSPRFLSIQLQSTTSNFYVVVDPATGDITQTSGSVEGSGKIAPATINMGNGWWRLYFVLTATDNGPLPIYYRVVQSGTDYLGADITDTDGVSGVVIANPHYQCTSQALCGEYFDSIYLGSVVTARNWCESSFVIKQDPALNPNDSWINATFAWQDPAAKRPWYPSDGSISAGAQVMISTRLTSMPSNYIDGVAIKNPLSVGDFAFSLMGRATYSYADGLDGGVPFVYPIGPAGYPGGYVLVPGAELGWNFPIPAQYTLRQTVYFPGIPLNNTTLLQLVATSGSDFLKVVCCAVTGNLELTTALGTLTLPNPAIVSADYLTFVISRDATTMTFAVYALRSQVYNCTVVDWAAGPSFNMLKIGSAANYPGTCTMPVVGNTEAWVSAMNPASIPAFIQVGLAPLGYANFVPFVPGTYTFDKACIAALLSAPPGAGIPALTALTWNIDFPDQSETNNLTCSATEWVPYTFQKVWHNPPNVVVYQPTGEVPVIGQVQDVTTTGFQARLVNTSGTQVAGAAVFVAAGY